MQRLFALLVVAMLTGTGCAKFNAGSGYRLVPESGDGLAVLSLTDDTRFFNYYLDYRGFDGRGGGQVTLWTLQNPLDWDTPRGRLVVLKLRAGDYVFHQLSNLSFSTDPFAINFHVEPGRVTYLGNVHVQEDGPGVEVTVNDRSSRDLGLFLQRYTNIRRDDVDIFIGRVEQGR